MISVFGSQSTGKSTLLNGLFHTKFDVMNETKRQQTTKGIWLAFSPKIESNELSTDENILVMDVEGSDGRERGEDQDFERKAALFALSTSEILIINLWEHQIGLYQGANMGLLKTVFEVNLSLFGNNDHKVLLLFVIRDHVGSTPLENLSNTLTTDLNDMWEKISKPKNIKQDCKLSDYFDIEFTTLSHKLLQPDNFNTDVKNLGDRFISNHDNYLFKNNYKQNFPIDGWTLYAENCWEQIQSNKDLDLPTQQILVARFRCDEIVKESLVLFDEKFEADINSIDLKSTNGIELSKEFIELKDSTLNYYDSQASHYNNLVYNDKRKTLTNEIFLKFKVVINSYIKILKIQSLSILKNFESIKTNSFIENLNISKEKSINNFNSNLNPITEINKEDFKFLNEIDEFNQDLSNELTNLKTIEISNLINKIVKKNFANIKIEVLELFNNVSNHEEIWDEILKLFNLKIDESLLKYKTKDNSYDFKIDENKNDEIYHNLKKQYWIEFDKFIHEYLIEDNVVNILRRKFEEKFNYDSNNVPRVWKNELDISNVYKNSTESTLLLLPVLSLAKLSNDSEIIPDEPIFEDEVDEDGDLHRFSHILNSTQQLKIKRQFLKQSEVNYRDANRSIISNVTKIPPFIYVLLIVLGWNEFMAILKNPLYLVLTILIGTGFFFINTLNLWGPLETTINILIRQIKEYIINSLDEKPKVIVESHELNDLSEKKNE